MIKQILKHFKTIKVQRQKIKDLECRLETEQKRANRNYDLLMMFAEGNVKINPKIGTEVVKAPFIIFKGNLTFKKEVNLETDCLDMGSGTNTFMSSLSVGKKQGDSNTLETKQ